MAKMNPYWEGKYGTPHKGQYRDSSGKIMSQESKQMWRELLDRMTAQRNATMEGSGWTAPAAVAADAAGSAMLPILGGAAVRGAMLYPTEAGAGSDIPQVYPPMAPLQAPIPAMETQMVSDPWADAKMPDVKPSGPTTTVKLKENDDGTQTVTTTKVETQPKPQPKVRTLDDLRLMQRLNEREALRGR